METNYLIELAKYSLKYTPFLESLPEKMTIKQFAEELKKEIKHHKELDREQKIM